MDDNRDTKYPIRVQYIIYQNISTSVKYLLTTDTDIRILFFFQKKKF
jgi:hypothetical protein